MVYNFVWPQGHNFGLGLVTLASASTSTFRLWGQIFGLVWPRG